MRTLVPSLLIVLQLSLLSALVGLDPAARAQTRSSSARSGQTPSTQVSPPRLDADERVQVYAYTFRHQAAADALERVRPLLSKQGTLELQPATNTLVVRDSLAAVTRIVPVLRSFDRAPREVTVQVMIVRAARAPASDGHRVAELPRWLEEKLRNLLRWDHYALLAEARLGAEEGQRVTHELADGYGVRFEIGAVEGRQVKLEDLSIWRQDKNGRNGQDGTRRQLLGADLNLRLDRPTALGLARSETSDNALMLVLICHETKNDRRPGRR